MAEKTVVTDAQAKKERFEFILTINGNIVCQRYFRIMGFRNESLSSIELVETIDKCVEMIDEDLKAKTALFNMYSAPQVFENVEEMNKWAKNPTFKLDVPSYVILRDSDDTYVWNGESMELYDKYFNKADFVNSHESEGEWMLKFSFLDNGREVCSKIWDASVYPRFVRSNIDLSNSKNKYENGDVYLPVETELIKIFIENQKDIIPLIISEICRTCSNRHDGFTTSDTYRTTTLKVVDGKETYVEDGEPVTYNYNIGNANYKYYKSLERLYRKKTNEYFRSR